MERLQFNINPRILEQIKDAKKSLDDSVKPFLSALSQHRESLKNLAKAIENMPLAINSLSKYGWFVNFDFTPGEILHLGKLVEEDDLNNVDHYMTDYIISNLDFMEKQIENEHHLRLPPLRQAFQAHKDGYFFTSIPVVLSQTEGIFKEFAGISIFGNENHAPSTKEWVSNINLNSVLQAFLDPLNFKEGIRNHKEDEFIGFTRNDVLHGENYKYGTEINSAKSISFMFYVISLIETIKTE